MSAFNAYRNFQQGNPAQGALNTTAAIGGGMRLASQSPGFLNSFGVGQYAPAIGTAGSALGAVGGLAGAGLAFANGDVRGGVQGTIGGLASAANLAPVGATLGGVPIASTAGGVAGTGLGAGVAAGAEGTTAAGSAAAGGATAAAGASIAGALGAIGLVYAAGFAVQNIVNAILGEGEYGKSPLPFGRSQNASLRFSAADNMASQKSKFAGMMGSNQVSGAIQSSPKDPNWLLGFMNNAGGLSQHGEVQIANKFGQGGDWRTEKSPEYAAAIQRAQAGDIPTIRDIIKTTQIQTGETGATNVDPKATESFRAKLLYSYPPEMRRQIGTNLDDVLGGPVSKDNIEAMFYRHQIMNPPGRDGMMRFGSVKLPVNHEYMSYNVNPKGGGPPRLEPITVEQAMLGLVGNAQAQVVKGQKWGQNPTMVYDKTANKPLSQNTQSEWQGNDLKQAFQIDPDYLESRKLSHGTAAAKEEAARIAMAKKQTDATKQAERDRYTAQMASMSQL
jgi:hypothetical protein